MCWKFDSENDGNPLFPLTLNSEILQHHGLWVLNRGCSAAPGVVTLHAQAASLDFIHFAWLHSVSSTAFLNLETSNDSAGAL